MSVPTSRRAMFGTALAGAAAVGAIASQSSEASTAAPAALRPLPASTDPTLRALRRLTFGVTPSLLSEVKTLGLRVWIDQQLAGLPDPSATLNGIGFSNDPLPPSLANQFNTAAGRDVVRDLQAATFAKAAFGDNQLEEVMVEFWSNHLSIYGYTVNALKVPDDQNVIRKNALGTFANMLKASAQSPAMLQYLNQAGSAGRYPNENYARELMELHTVGVHGGYQQKDVHNAALALTGLTIDYNTGLYEFQSSWHPLGRVTVMSWTSANNKSAQAESVALSLVNYLAHHPMTAKRIATKLVTRFVNDVPPAGLIESAAQVYLANGTAIKPVLQHIFSSYAFLQSPGLKTQRPYEWAVAAVRKLNLQPTADLQDNNGAVVNMLNALGQAPFGWGQPNGYPDVTQAWASTSSMLNRWNLAQELVYGRIYGLQAPDFTTLIGLPAPLTAGDLVVRLSEKLLNEAPRAALKAGVLHAVGAPSARVLSRVSTKDLAPRIAALLLSSPEAMVR